MPSEPVSQPPDRPAGLPWRELRRRLVPLLVAGVGFYVVWPALRDTWGAAPALRDAHPGWFLAMGALQVASHVCLWQLLRVALDLDDRFLVATSQLASTAVGRVVPGGGAAAAALQHQMLVRGGLEPVRSGTGVTVVAILANGLVFLLPIASVPTILGPTAVPDSLLRAAAIGLLIALALGGIAAAVLTSDRLVRRIGRVVAWIGARLRRRGLGDLDERLADERVLLMQFLGPRWVRAVAWTIGRIGLDYLSLLAALAAVGATPRAGLVVLAFVAAYVLGSIPITPGGLGFVEAGLTATLTVSGVPGATAAAATLAYRLASYWMPLLAGGPAYLAFARRYGRLPATRPDAPS